jgi:hypothetical protein
LRSPPFMTHDNSPLGDFTIVQNGQPAIEKMLRDRVQVVQDDSRAGSTEPHFHVMLKHYGDMRAQIVTPLFHEDSLAAALSIHSLGQVVISARGLAVEEVPARCVRVWAVHGDVFRFLIGRCGCSET